MRTGTYFADRSSNANMAPSSVFFLNCFSRRRASRTNYLALLPSELSLNRVRGSCTVEEEASRWRVRHSSSVSPACVSPPLTARAATGGLGNAAGPRSVRPPLRLRPTRTKKLRSWVSRTSEPHAVMLPRWAAWRSSRSWKSSTPTRISQVSYSLCDAQRGCLGFGSSCNGRDFAGNVVCYWCMIPWCLVYACYCMIVCVSVNAYVWVRGKEDYPG